MSNPNEPPESSPSETPNPSPNSEQISQMQQQASNIFNEIVDDITNKKDLDVILGVVAVVLSVVTLVIKATSTTLINMLLYSTPILSGWVLHAGYSVKGKNNKTKLLALGGISFGLFVVALYDIAGGLAGIKQFSDTIRSIPRF